MSYLINKQWSSLDQHPMFDLLFNDSRLGFNRSSRKSYQINETDDSFNLMVECPGFKKSELDINYEQDILSISAKSDEGFNSELNQAFEIPNIDLKKSTAELTNGILKLTLYKVASAKKQKLNIN